MSLLQLIYDDLKLKFINYEINFYETFIWFKYTFEKNIIIFEIYAFNSIDATCENTLESYTDELFDILNTLDYLDQYEIPTNAIDILISNKFDSSGFDDTQEFELDNKIKKDYLYKELLLKIKDPLKDIEFFSFGETKHPKPHILEQQKLYDKTFDARYINSAKPKGLRDLRGTDEIIQKCIESGSGFDFIMNCIINYIEINNSRIIGIYCRSGHHRSVAVVELLKKHIYVNAKIKHLDINK